MIRELIRYLLAAVMLTSCAQSPKQDENLAAQRAIEFAQIVLVNKNFDQGYELLSDGGKRHISLAILKETMTRLHPRGFPTRVTAKEYQPMPGENALWILLTGQNDDDQFQYRFTMEATASGDYKVLSLDSGGIGRFISPAGRKPFTKVISTQP
jgi:hypothetical protein